MCCGKKRCNLASTGFERGYWGAASHKRMANGIPCNAWLWCCAAAVLGSLPRRAVLEQDMKEFEREFCRIVRLAARKNQVHTTCPSAVRRDTVHPRIAVENLGRACTFTTFFFVDWRLRGLGCHQCPTHVLTTTFPGHTWLHTDDIEFSPGRPPLFKRLPRGAKGGGEGGDPTPASEGAL